VPFTAGQRAASITHTLSYDSAQLALPGRDPSAAGTTNTPSTGSVLLHVVGVGLGSADRSPRARIGNPGATAAEWTGWLSDTSLSLFSPGGRAQQMFFAGMVE
jgi:hypothetical protein